MINTIVIQNKAIDKDLAEKFLSWFPHRYDWIYREVGKSWYTESKYPLNDNELLEKWADTLVTVGVRFGKTTRYAMIDIDKDSPYHPKQNKEAIAALKECLRLIGLNACIILQSSDSGGFHLYFSLPEEVSSFYLAKAIKLHLEASGFIVAGGILEIFPNPKSFVKQVEGEKPVYSKYNGHRLPLQLDSHLIDDEGVYTGCNSISVFCDWMDWAANRQDMEQLNGAIAEYKNVKNYSYFKRDSKDVPESDVTKKWREDLYNTICRGWIGKSQTNDILKEVQKYGKVFCRLSGVELIDWMDETAQRMNGYKQYCEHQNEIRQRCKEWVQCTESKNYYVPYRDRPDRLKKDENGNLIKPENKNTTKSLDASNRILEAINSITDTIFSTTRDLLLFLQNQTKKLFGLKVSLKTLYKNKSLWEPLINRDNSSTESKEAEITSLSNLESVLHLSIYEGVGSLVDSEESQDSNLEVLEESENTENVQDLEKVEEIIKLEIENKQVKQENSTKLDNQQKKTKNFSLDCLNLLVYRLKIFDFIGKFREIHDSS